MSFNINGKNLNTYFNARPSGSYGTDTTGLTNYRINGVDLINYYYKPGTNGTIYNSNLKYTGTPFRSGSTSIDISTLFQLNLIKSGNVTYDTIAINNGVIIKITAAPPIPTPSTNDSSYMEFNFPINIADILIVGGGGGGGAANGATQTAGGGGGAGQVGVINWSNISNNNVTFRRLINISIGEGGSGAIFGQTSGANGSQTALRMVLLPSNYTFICYGGGGGGSGNRESPNVIGGSSGGGSSGGSGANTYLNINVNDTDANNELPSGTNFNDGSINTINTNIYMDYFAKRGGKGAAGSTTVPEYNEKPGGGGGGASAVGNINGGDGYTWNNIVVGGGGGGGSGKTVWGTGGTGGGGKGGRWAVENIAGSGDPNSGGGGGGAPNQATNIGNRNGGAGGSGVIYIRILQDYVVF